MIRLAAIATLMTAPLFADEQRKLHLTDVIAAVTSRYPPYLMALIERDIASGRLRQAQAAFDVNFLAKGSFNPTGFYDGGSADFVFDQPLPFWGGNVFAGYRISSGSLADYDKSRTQTDGEVRAGIKLNLLRDGPIDRRRADLWKARLDQELADPFIQRQLLDIVRSASRAYYNWLAMGQRLGVTQQLLDLARDRQSAIADMAKKGISAPILVVDNERLVVSRQLALIQARRRFEAASIEVSLFLRGADDEPRTPVLAELPAHFPPLRPVPKSVVGPEISKAFDRRPELNRIRLVRQKLDVDWRLARNGLQPHLDLSASVSENIGSSPYKDRKETETAVGVELRLPLQRNEAKGRLQTVEAELQRLERDAQFARDRIVAEVRDAWSAQHAALEVITQSRRNVDLARQLEEAEQKRVAQGASDLLALQLREQATFDARLLEIDSQADFFRAKVDYHTAAGEIIKP